MKTEKIKDIKIDKLEKKVKEQSVPTPVRKSRSYLIRAILLVLIASFIVLAYFANTMPYFPIDLFITTHVQTITSPVFLEIMQLISFVGYPPQVYFFIIAISVFLYLTGLRWEAVVSLGNGASVGLVNVIIKTLIHRDRPSADLVRVVKHLTEYSFPSGHVMVYTAFFGFLFFLTYTMLKKRTPRYILLTIWLLLILLIAPSRIYLGAHWASDVFGAYLFGTIWLILTIYVYEWGKKKSFLKNST